MTLSTYHLLGRTGLRVSLLTLGTMTFGNDSWGWGTGKDTSRAIIHRYVEAGGNVVDTANAYGNSEEVLGGFLAETGWRDQLALATKLTGARRPGDPNAVGNGRKNILASLDASLRRLQTDYIDVYWLHVWDGVAPVEEVMSTLDSLVRSGKVRAIGLSDVPVWYATKAQLRAQAQGWEPVAALQLEYSLIDRTIEREHIPAALDLGIGITPFSPLASGFLSGKYTGTPERITGEGRVQAEQQAGYGRTYSDQDWTSLAVLEAVAEEFGRSPAQVAISWITHRPGVVSTLIGARTIEQLDDNLGALDFDLSAEQAQRLTEISRPSEQDPYDLIYNLLGSTNNISTHPAWHTT